MAGNMESGLSESIRNQVVIISKHGMSGALKHFGETGSAVSKTQSGGPKVITPLKD